MVWLNIYKRVKIFLIMNLRKAIGSPISVVIMATVSVLIVMSAFSGLLPQASVVESGSMQHSDSWTAGVINTGDMVFERHVDDPVNDVVTYVQGRTSGFSTYGDYGNVVLYQSAWNYTIVHRAMFYLAWNGSIPVVAGYQGQEWLKITRDLIVVSDVGQSHRNLVVSLYGLTGESGFITMGDYNLVTSNLNVSGAGGYLAVDQNVFGFRPIPVENVSNIAYGQIPWLGLIKLNLMRLQGDWQYYYDVPKNSYLFLGLSMIAVSGMIGLAFYVVSRAEKKKLK